MSEQDGATWYNQPDLRAALAVRDFTTVYRWLKTTKTLTQRQIAALTGQSQSEVAEICKGRRVIAPTLGFRVTLALPQPGAEQLPSRLSMSHVHAIEAITDQLRAVARQYGGQAGLFGAAVKLYTPWLGVSATDAVKARLGGALAELHTEAGWCGYDAGMDAAGYFTRALRLADAAGDAYGIANAAWHAGATLMRSGHPDTALKAFQLGQCALAGFQPGKSTPAISPADDPRVATLTARLNRNSATAYALMEHPRQAERALVKTHEKWAPRDRFDHGGMDLATAGVHLDLRRLDTAAQFAASAVRAYGDVYGRERVNAELLLAEIHLRGGEPRGLPLARRAIDAVRTVHSVAVRRERLLPLAVALETRPGSDARELARLARTIVG
jgi:hypothetical protein